MDHSSTHPQSSKKESNNFGGKPCVVGPKSVQHLLIVRFLRWFEKQLRDLWLFSQFSSGVHWRRCSDRVVQMSCFLESLKASGQEQGWILYFVSWVLMELTQSLRFCSIKQNKGFLDCPVQMVVWGQFCSERCIQKIDSPQILWQSSCSWEMNEGNTTDIEPLELHLEPLENLIATLIKNCFTSFYTQHDVMYNFEHQTQCAWSLLVVFSSV